MGCKRSSQVTGKQRGATVKYQIESYWSVSTYEEIEAATLEEAIDKAGTFNPESLHPNVYLEEYTIKDENGDQVAHDSCMG